MKPTIIAHYLGYDMFIIFGCVKFGMQIDCEYSYCFLIRLAVTKCLNGVKI